MSARQVHRADPILSQAGSLSPLGTSEAQEGCGSVLKAGLHGHAGRAGEETAGELTVALAQGEVVVGVSALCPPVGPSTLSPCNGQCPTCFRVLPTCDPFFLKNIFY